jgi:hypothetical protein
MFERSDAIGCCRRAGHARGILRGAVLAHARPAHQADRDPRPGGYWQPLAACCASWSRRFRRPRASTSWLHRDLGGCADAAAMRAADAERSCDRLYGCLAAGCRARVADWSTVGRSLVPSCSCEPAGPLIRRRRAVGHTREAKTTPPLGVCVARCTSRHARTGMRGPSAPVTTSPGLPLPSRRCNKTGHNQH